MYISITKIDMDKVEENYAVRVKELEEKKVFNGLLQYLVDTYGDKVINKKIEEYINSYFISIGYADGEIYASYSSRDDKKYSCGKYYDRSVYISLPNTKGSTHITCLTGWDYNTVQKEFTYANILDRNGMYRLDSIEECRQMANHDMALLKGGYKEYNECIEYIKNFNNTLKTCLYTD